MHSDRPRGSWLQVQHQLKVVCVCLEEEEMFYKISAICTIIIYVESLCPNILLLCSSQKESDMCSNICWHNGPKSRQETLVSCGCGTHCEGGPLAVCGQPCMTDCCSGGCGTMVQSCMTDSCSVWVLDYGAVLYDRLLQCVGVGLWCSLV